MLSKRKDAETAINYVRLEKGCGVIGTTPKVELDGIEYYSCLCHDNFKDSSVSEYMWLYNQYKLGHLGFEGSLLEQPSKYIELIRLMNKLDVENQNRITEEQNKG